MRLVAFLFGLLVLPFTLFAAILVAVGLMPRPAPATPVAAAPQPATPSRLSPLLVAGVVLLVAMALIATMR